MAAFSGPERSEEESSFLLFFRAMYFYNRLFGLDLREINRMKSENLIIPYPSRPEDKIVMSRTAKVEDIKPSRIHLSEQTHHISSRSQRRTKSAARSGSLWANL